MFIKSSSSKTDFVGLYYPSALCDVLRRSGRAICLFWTMLTFVTGSIIGNSSLSILAIWWTLHYYVILFELKMRADIVMLALGSMHFWKAMTFRSSSMSWSDCQLTMKLTTPISFLSFSLTANSFKVQTIRSFFCSASWIMEISDDEIFDEEMSARELFESDYRLRP